MSGFDNRPPFDPLERSSYLQDVDLNDEDKQAPAPRSFCKFSVCKRWGQVKKRLFSPSNKASDDGADGGDACPPDPWMLLPYLVAGSRYRGCALWSRVLAQTAAVLVGLSFLVVTLWYSFYCPECYTCLSQAREAGDDAVCPYSMVTKNGRVMICSARDGSVWVEPRIVAVDDTKIAETEEVYRTAAKCPTVHYFSFRYTSILVSAVDALTGTYHERMPFGGLDAVCMQHILYKRVLGHGCRPVATFVVNGENRPSGFSEFKGRVIQ